MIVLEKHISIDSIRNIRYDQPVAFGCGHHIVSAVLSKNDGIALLGWAMKHLYFKTVTSLMRDLLFAKGSFSTKS